MKESPELRDAVEGELRDLIAELDSVQPLLDKVFATEPDAIELRAIAATLHAYYNGVERVFVLIAKNFSELPVESHTWHRDLLKLMSTSTDRRPQVISHELCDELSQLLGFRHFFRHAYPMRLKWDLLRPLVKHLEVSRRAFKREIYAFLTTLDQ